MSNRITTTSCVKMCNKWRTLPKTKKSSIDNGGQQIQENCTTKFLLTSAYRQNDLKIINNIFHRSTIRHPIQDIYNNATELVSAL